MLRVSDNRRYLVHDDGRPFFYLADTAWELFHRLTREEAARYLADRAAKGFTVIQAVALAEMDGLTLPNSYGHLPLEGNDPARPLEPYFLDVDRIIDEAARLGLHVALLPTWGDKWNRKWGAGPEVFTPENARAYGRFLGARYRDRPIIWVLGGDRAVETPAHHAVIDSMAAGIGEGEGGRRHLTTFHPSGAASSSNFVHDRDWLDFNCIQSGHNALIAANWKLVREDYERTPAKPTLDSEPNYENHPAGFQAGNGIYFGEHHVRMAAYWGVFSGACGHTYGCHDVWPMATEAWRPVPTIRGTWEASLQLPGAGQLQHLKRLVLSRPYLTRIPDVAASLTDRLSESSYAPVTRDGSPGPGARDATYLMAYSPLLRLGLGFDTSALRGDRVRAWRFSPRTGAATLIHEGERPARYAPPLPADDGPDWVWVIDAADAGYGPPGAAR